MPPVFDALASVPPDHSWLDELKATVRLAWPLVVSQLVFVVLGITDTVMVGWLGAEKLAAGSLASSVQFNLFLGFGYVLSAVAPMAAQALSQGDMRSVRNATRQGFWASLILFAGLAAILWNGESLLLLLGQQPLIASRGASYIDTAMWGFFPAMLVMVLRHFLSVHGDTLAFMWISLFAIGLNFLGNYALMFGNFGFPRLELVGAGIATSLVQLFMFATLLFYCLTHRRFRDYNLLKRFWKLDFQSLREIFVVGVPVGVATFAESSFFGAASVAMGWIDADSMAAHAIAVQCVSLAFMVPLGLSQASTIRVGLAAGMGSRDLVKKAGWVSIILAIVFMSTTALTFTIFSSDIPLLFLDPSVTENLGSLEIAGDFLLIGGIFQIADGGQAVLASIMRGLKDTRTPMALGVFCYWAVGVGIAYLFGFSLGLSGQGIWIGAATALYALMFSLLWRFIHREKLGLMRNCDRA